MGYKNYYDILGVDRNADLRAIKRAYRLRAKECHPDNNANDKAAQRFRELQEAYEVLSDALKRNAYDKVYSGQQNNNDKADADKQKDPNTHSTSKTQNTQEHSTLGRFIKRLRTASSTIWEDYLFPAMGFTLLGCLALALLLSLYQNFGDVVAFVLYIILGFSPLIVFAIVELMFSKFEVVIPKWYGSWVVHLIWPVIIGMFLWMPSYEYLREAYRPFGLSVNDTLLDYKLASLDSQADWNGRVFEYPNILCMSSRASSCGHWVNDETREKFSNCVSYAMQGADPSKKLGDACKECLIQPAFRNPESAKRCQYPIFQSNKLQTEEKDVQESAPASSLQAEDLKVLLDYMQPK